MAGDLADLVAPPYDVIGPEQREQLRQASPFNVVHLTLPDSEAEAAAALADWRARGVLVEEPEPAYWWLAQDYEGPDGVRRRREGFVAALRVEPYENRVVLPHERTHAGPKEGRLRLLRATRTHLEPLFFLWDGSIDVEGLGEPDLESGGDRLWRLAPEFGEALTAELADAQLLIADGHHRYETALAAGAEWLLAVIVPAEQEGLTIFPTHRVFSKKPDPTWLGFGRAARSPEEALAEIERMPRSRAAAVLYDGATQIAETDTEELDVLLVDRLGHEGISYTQHWVDAVREVDRGSAELAVLLRPLDLGQVWEVARRGDVMPQKSTFFYPKLTSGLLMLPLD